MVETLEKLLFREYVRDRKSIRQIARILGHSFCFIQYNLKKYGIPIRSMSEAHIGIRPSIKTREKISNTMKGFKHSPESIEKMKLNHADISGSKNYWYGKRLSIDHRRKLSLGKLGPKNPNFGKPPKHGKHEKYKGIWMRSSWEILYAKWLDRNNIKRLYEPKTFILSNITYTPDFYLPEIDEFIEIKGWWHPNTKKKFNLFRKLYTDIKIKILMKP